MGQEIIPPRASHVARQREETQVQVHAPRMGNFIDRAVTTWQHNGHAKALDAVARHTNAARGAADAHTALVHAGIRYADAMALARDTPERHEHELALRRLHREDGLNEAVHGFKQNVIRREKEMEQSEAELVVARSMRRKADVVLLDADQQLQAQREFGYAPHVLAHKKRGLEILKVELDEAEARALWQKHYGAQAAGGGGGDDDSSDDDAVINEALLRSRQDLKANGLDTSAIDTVIRARRDK